MNSSKTILHINYCDQGQTLEYTCRKAREWGYDGIEFWAEPGEMETGEYLDRIAAAYEKEKLSAIHFGGGIKLDPRNPEREKGLATFFHFYEQAAARFDLTVCNLQTDGLVDESRHSYFHYEEQGSALATEEIVAWQVKGLRDIAAFAEGQGFQFAFETHHAYYHDLPAMAKRLVTEVGSPALGVLFDYGNVIGFADPPSLAECIDTLGESLIYVHLKNSLSTGTRQRQRCALGDGEINHREFLRLLAENGYEGNICLESPRAGDGEFFARKDIRYFKSLTGEMEPASR